MDERGDLVTSYKPLELSPIDREPARNGEMLKTYASRSSASNCAKGWRRSGTGYLVDAA